MRPRLVFAALLLCLDMPAQDRVGSITGTITDPDGRAVVNAAVEARNIATATIYKATTSGSGNYTLAKLPTGTYNFRESDEVHFAQQDYVARVGAEGTEEQYIIGHEPAPTEHFHSEEGAPR